MAYATVDDMTKSFGEDELITVTTPRGVERTVIDQDQVNTAIGVASDEIDSYLRRRYAVPLVTAPPTAAQRRGLYGIKPQWSRI
ncbi:MAG: phage protein Gp36 family protein [Acetobacter sp.]|uniref:phage protein Gp36 family protein n=1 Tax=Acetobacter sp. TaxID=440 RepID=UPI0039EBD927